MTFFEKLLLSSFGQTTRERAIIDQKKTLRKLLKKAQTTAFGHQHGFKNLLEEGAFFDDFQAAVPLSDYQKMAHWWQKAVAGAADVTWPGRVPFFATSSGTSDSRQKAIPVTAEMVKKIVRGGTRQFLAMRKCGLPAAHFQRKILCVSASSELKMTEFGAREGYISGITSAKMPKWFEFYHKPGRRINGLEWEEKIEEIVRRAPSWDVGSLVGLPNWTLIILERIAEAYGLRTIHDLWPNLAVFQHSGMHFEPYRARFEAILGRPLVYLESYFASEGLFAITDRPAARGMKLLADAGIFFEFIPFDDQNFGLDGQPLEGARCLTLADDLAENQPYALVVSTCAGAWRYLLGDVVRFVDLERLEIAVAGRTTTFLNLCGEHLTEANLAAAVGWLNAEHGAGIEEFCIAPGRTADGWFAHRWFLGSKTPFSGDFLAKKLDERLRELNEYYDFERSVSLAEVSAEVVPPEFFQKWLAEKGRVEPQRKFPRVLSGRNLELWNGLFEKAAWAQRV